MAPPPQYSMLYNLPDEIFEMILEYSLVWDSPFWIDPPRRDPRYSRGPPGRKPAGNNYIAPPPVLESSTGIKDPLFTNIGYLGNTPSHQRTPQSIHRKDGITMNSTNRRIRRLGKIAFFRSKTIAMLQDLPARLLLGEFKPMVKDDQALALHCIRNIVIVDPPIQSPSWYLQLPRLLSDFPSLKGCMLLFGFVEEADPEWITAAVVLGGPVPLEMQELIVKIGLGKGKVLEEAMGPAENWVKHREDMQTFIMPMLRMKVGILEAKERRDAEKRAIS